MKHELTPAEKWERLSFKDNYIFCKVMETNPDICKKMLELLLNIEIEQIEIPTAERSVKVAYDSKGIRLDVYVKDSTGRSFDIEVQTSISKKLSLLKRARYYQGLMDVDSVFAGEDYRKLNETYVLFLCIGDPFGHNKPVYTFENVCKKISEENKTATEETQATDGTHKIFFDAKKYDTMKSKELKAFFKYLCKKEPTSDFTDKISAMVKRIKMNPRWRHEYMTWEQEIKFQANLAYDEGAEEKAIETAHNFLEMGISPEKVSKGTGIPLEQVLKLKEQTHGNFS